MRSADPTQLAEDLLAGDRRALARALTVVESGGADAEALLLGVYGRAGAAWRTQPSSATCSARL